MERLTRLVDSLDGVSPRRLLWINVVCAFLVLIAHGGALALAWAGKAPEIAATPEPLYVSVLLSALVLVTGAWALRKPASALRVLKFHTVYFVLLVVGLLWSAIEWALFGIPTSENFSWNPVLFLFLCMYPVYLARRTFMASASTTSAAVKYSHVVAGLASLLISAVVMWRLFDAAL